MLVELKDPETADVIAQTLASKFVGFSLEELVNIESSSDQLKAFKMLF
jgi:hypothetical protein